MSIEEARERWSERKCPFGVGDESGKCCTSECAAWKEWDTRETLSNTEEVWKDYKPGWFSDWRVIDTRSGGGYYDYTVEDRYREWVPKWKEYLWAKTTSRETGGTGGYCIRLRSE